MTKLREVYADRGIIVRTKAPQLRIVLWMITVLMFPLVLNDLLGRDYLNMAIELIIVVSMAGSIVLLHRGRYDVASVIPLVVSTAAVLGLAFLIRVETRFQIYTVALYVVPPVMISLAISERTWHTIATSLVGTLTIVTAAVTRVLPVLRATGRTEGFSEALIVATVVYSIAAAIAVLVASSNQKALRQIESDAIRNTETLERIGAVSTEAKHSLDSSTSVENNYDAVRHGAGQIQQQVETLTESIARLRSNLSGALASVSSIADRVISFHNQVDEQNTVVQESTASVNEMSASLDSVASITATRKESSERLHKVAEEGVALLEASTRSFETARTKMHALTEINSIVGDIAAQTSLLSMNAAIEAAHAGESGKGFAVVAEEIRKLATSTSENSQTISENLRDLTESIQESAEHSAKTTEAMSRISTEVKDVVHSFEEITGSTAELSQGGREIMSAMQVLQNTSNEVRDGSDQISREQQGARIEMEHIEEVAAEMESALREVRNAIGSINTAMLDLETTIAASTEVSSQLHGSITAMLEERT